MTRRLLLLYCLLSFAYCSRVVLDFKLAPYRSIRFVTTPLPGSGAAAPSCRWMAGSYGPLACAANAGISTTLDIGTPAQRFPVDVDITSDDLVVPDCATSSARNCYLSELSSSSSTVGCTSRYNLVCESGGCAKDLCSYASPIGYEIVVAVDTLAMNGVSVPEALFGRLTAGNATIRGHLGLGHTDRIGYTTLLDTLVDRKLIAARQFSLCLSSRTANSGLLVFGGSDSPTRPRPYVYTPYASGHTKYQIKIEGLRVGTEPHALGPRHRKVVLSTLTTDFTVPTLAEYRALMSAFVGQAACGTSSAIPGLCGNATVFEQCLPLTAAAIARYPTLTFQLAGGAEVVLTGEDYLVAPDGDSESRCMAIGVSSYKHMVLGTVVLRRYSLLFDRQNTRVGFAAGTCLATEQYYLEAVSDISQPMSCNLANLMESPFEARVQNNMTGQPVAGVTVSFAVESGDAQIDWRASQVTTDSNGVARVYLHCGRLAVTTVVSASVPNSLGSPLYFNLQTTVPYDADAKVWLIVGGLFLFLSFFLLGFAHRRGGPFLHKRIFNTLNTGPQLASSAPLRHDPAAAAAVN